MFTYFEKDISHLSVPDTFTYPFSYTPHPLSILASEQLQNHLQSQSDWEHNFGLNPDQKGRAIGKMFGVLVVKNREGVLGYLSGFSGKLANANHHPGFVPPIYDSLSDSSFLNTGMPVITAINNEIKSLETDKVHNQLAITNLKEKRKQHSHRLQQLLFDEYSFLNKDLESKNVREIFKVFNYKNPPAGAGECAAPKLLQYAFQQGFTLVCMAEFWWGVSLQSENWEHKLFYPACKEKCEPILKHMLEGIELEELKQNT